MKTPPQEPLPGPPALPLFAEPYPSVPATPEALAGLESPEEELCRRIVHGDRRAALELFALYRHDGSVSLLVPLARAADGDSYCWGIVFNHALQVLGLQAE